MKIRMAMLVSPTEERRMNAESIKEILPELDLIHADANKEDLFDKHLDVLRQKSIGVSGVLMMEDDVILCRDFRKRFLEVLKHYNGSVIQFFEKALAKVPPSRGWQNGANFFSCVCYYAPTDVIELITDADTRREFREEVFPKKHEPWGYPIDTYIAYVLKKHKLKYWREIPYLVQHQDFKSTIGNRSTKRQSKFFIDDLEDI